MLCFCFSQPMIPTTELGIHTMSEIGLKARILLMTLAPTGLLAIALGSYFIWHASQDLQQQLLERGFLTVEHLQMPSHNSSGTP